MIVGNGQIAKAFEGTEYPSKTVIFASGVANSNCTEELEFQREKALLLNTLRSLDGRAIVYFSSCALSAKDYLLTPYYQHKKNMESLIKEHTNNYYIFRVPQLFGKMKRHPTLINYLYYAIKEEREFALYDGVYRYLIELNDLKLIVMEYLRLKRSGVILDVANTHRYSILDIVEELEILLGKKAKYEKFSGHCSYEIDLSTLELFITDNKLDILFGKGYLTRKLNK